MQVSELLPTQNVTRHQSLLGQQSRRMSSFSLALFLLVLGLAVTGCSPRVNTPFGFSLPAVKDVAVDPIPGSEYKKRVAIRHRQQPSCLSGSIEPFLKLKPKQYFQRLNHELDLSRRRPFLARPAVVGHTAHTYYSYVRAYDEEGRAYRPAYVLAFQAQGQLWVGWLHLGCPAETYRQLGLALVLGLRVD